MPSPRRVFVPAYAKINWTLDVLGKRSDGYHELKSVMQTIALGDTLCFTPDAPGTAAFTCDDPALDTQENLVVRAAHAARQYAPASAPGARIELRKRTPAQAGLGGGSSDAASTLVALNALWRLGLGIAELERIGAELGSDVPFFIRGGTAVIAGRGEQVTALPDAEQLWLVLVKPPVSVPTAAVFHALTPEDFGHGAWTDAVAAAVRAGEPLPFEALHNDLEPGVLRTFPAVAAAYDALRRAGAPVVRMSGSGSALFAPVRELAAAARIHEVVAATGLSAWLTHTIPANAAHGALGAARPDACQG